MDIAHLRAIASRINDTANPTVTALGGWGTWVNGGAWLTIGGQRVDWLYRNLDFVSATLAACNAGQIRSDYWQQPAYGFHSFMYCTETAICRPLYDPEGVIEQLKSQVAHYSPQLKQAIISRFLWQARFTLDNTAKPAARAEVYLVTGCLARSMHCLVQVLYALNETYYLSEKRLAVDRRTFRLQPQGFVERLSLILGKLEQPARSLRNPCDRPKCSTVKLRHWYRKGAYRSLTCFFIMGSHFTLVKWLPFWLRLPIYLSPDRLPFPRVAAFLRLASLGPGMRVGR